MAQFLQDTWKERGREADYHCRGREEERTRERGQQTARHLGAAAREMAAARDIVGPARLDYGWGPGRAGGIRPAAAPRIARRQRPGTAW